MMGGQESIIFGARKLVQFDFKNKSVIEIGSRYINGGLKKIVEDKKPAEYIGIDIIKGKDVDTICSAEDILKKFGKERFDFVITTETLEHVNNWKLAISNIKNVCKPNGIILITTRSYGYPIHSYPSDFWRYDMEDIERIFSDCIILCLEKDESAPGIFLVAQKPDNFKEINLSDYKLYSILYKMKIKSIPNSNINKLPAKIRIKLLKIKIKNYIIYKFDYFISKLLKIDKKNLI